MQIRTSLVVIFLLLIGTTTSFGQQSTVEETVKKTLDSFHQAIIDNDTQKAQVLLSDSVRILESGNIEAKEEYLSHHFHSDGKFLSAMNRKINSQTVTVEENTAWVSTQSRTWGIYNERELDLNSLELAVLQKKNGSWKVAALHWSSSNNQ